MSSIKTYLNGLGRAARTTILALAVVFVSAGIAQAATTISTNISTAGTLGVTGLSSLGSASSTQFSANTAYFGETATSTFSSAGALTLLGALSGTSGTFSTTLGVTGKTTLSNASTTQSATIGGPLWIGGNATTTAAGALSLQSTLTVGASGNAVNNIVGGYCVTDSITIPATNASSTQTYTNCTPQGSAASLLTASSRVFVQATSSLPYYVVVQSASSTAGALINIGLTNFSTSTSPAASVYAFNFWAFQ